MTTVPGRLYGVGVGPGDPELLTLKAVHILETVDRIFAPKKKQGERSLALDIICENVNIEGKVELLDFPMTADRERLKGVWQETGERIAGVLAEGKEAAFITVGDPLLYSTYIYIMETIQENHPEVEIETIPGISSVSAAAAALNLPLAKDEEQLLIHPAIKTISDELLLEVENVALLKVKANFSSLRTQLHRLGVAAGSVLVSRCGYPDESTTPLDGSGCTEKTPDYMSLVIKKDDTR